MSDFSVFGMKPVGSILFPELPIVVSNDCSISQWRIDDVTYGSKLSITIAKFAKFYGTYKNVTTLWGQIWFLVETGELPKETILVTYIKDRSLSAFNKTIAEIQSLHVEPATKIFVPYFIRHTATKDNNTVTYYSVGWKWEDRTDLTSLNSLISSLSMPDNSSCLHDPNMADLICLDGKSATEKTKIMSDFQSRLLLSSSDNY